MRELLPWVGTEEVPPVPFQIQEHGEPSVWFVSRRRNDLDAVGHQTLVGCLEIIDAEEHADASGELPAGDALLLHTIGSREQNASVCSHRSNDDPSLRPTIVGPRGRIFDEFELEDVDKEPDRRVIVPDHQRDKFEMRHGASGYPESPSVRLTGPPGPDRGASRANFPCPGHPIRAILDRLCGR
jgi:hypothetical protein